MCGKGAVASLDLREDELFDFAYARFIALIEGPLLDALAANQAGNIQDFEMFAGGGLADAQFPGDVEAANAVTEEIAVDLRGKVAAGILEPGQNLEAAATGESAKSEFHIHIDD